MNSFKRVCAFQIELEFGNVGFEEREKPDYPDMESNGENQQQTQPTYGFDAGI